MSHIIMKWSHDCSNTGLWNDKSIPTKGPTLNRRSSKSYVTSPE
jgi:hypothetical protein